MELNSQVNAQFPDVEEVMESKLKKPVSFLKAWQANWGFYTGKKAIHPACCGCGRLYPEWIYTMEVANGFNLKTGVTRCCHEGAYDWKFVVGTRRKTSRLVLLRGKELRERGIWSAMSM